MMDTERTEYNLAQLARDGDREALAELVERVRPWLFTVAYAELQHYQDAQDAVASALLQICLHVDALREPECVRMWMHRIVRNEAYKILRSRPKTVCLPDELYAPESNTDVQLLRLDILSALRQLPKDQARAVALFHLAGVSINEIARRTGRPEGTIKRWLCLGRRRLATKLEGYVQMTQTMTATIISTDINEITISEMKKAMVESGFGKVTLLSELPSLDRTGTDDAVEFHLPKQLADTRFVILDEQVGGRSAFELHTILKVAAESKDMAFCILLASPISENTLFAAWAAGFDLCLGRDKLDIAEFKRFCGQILSQLKAGK